MTRIPSEDSLHRRRRLSPYAHASYVNSLKEFGTPLHLQRSGGWLIRRPIDRDGGKLSDACGPYPLFDCENWSMLDKDLDALSSEVISVVLVTDPWCEATFPDLCQHFPDCCKEFKKHYQVHLPTYDASQLPENHRRNIRRALSNVRVEHVECPASLLDDWCRLYSVLIDHRSLDGVQAFSRSSFAGQLSLPQCEAFVAHHDGQLCGASLWLMSDDLAYYHLAAYSPDGYATKASFGLFHTALMHFRERGLHAASLGAGAGNVDAEDGLTRFKRGWSTYTLPVYLCGRLLDPDASKALCQPAERNGESSYFPPYRSPVAFRQASDATSHKG